MCACTQPAGRQLAESLPRLLYLSGIHHRGAADERHVRGYVSGTRANGSRLRWTVDRQRWARVLRPLRARRARGGLSPAYNVLVNLAANPKLRVSPQFAAIYTLADDGHSRLWRVRPYVVLRPSSALGSSWERAISATRTTRSGWPTPATLARTRRTICSATSTRTCSALPAAWTSPSARPCRCSCTPNHSSPPVGSATYAS